MEKLPLNIIIAEDDFIICQDVKRMLTRIGHNVVCEVSNGKDAVEKTIELEPDLIMMDIKMPDLDGLEASKLIQEEKSTPIVVLTSYDDDELTKKAADHGVSAFLVKPTNEEELKRVIIIALARHDDLIKCIKLNQELQEALEEIKTLRGIIPICSYCKKIRDNKGYWNQVEEYISHHTAAEFSHGMCPECEKKIYEKMGIAPDD